MPSTYAHYRFGQEVRRLITGEEKRAVDSFSQLYNIGLHGPDIMFYYKPIKSNDISKTGHMMHDRPGKEFFESAARTVRDHGEDPRYASYVYGFICHFALDVTCHGYVDRYAANSGISHTEIETEFDRMLMIKDGYDPIRHRLAGHISCTPENAGVIAGFFPGITDEQVLKALKGMVFYCNLLVAPWKAKRFVIDTALKISGSYHDLHWAMVSYEENIRCRECSQKLWELYGKAVKLAVSLIEEFKDYLENKSELSSAYDLTFGSQLV